MAPELVVPRDGPRRLRVRRSWVRAGFTALFGVAFGLGLWGFWLYRTSPDFEWGTTGWDLVYYSVQLFVLGAEATNQGGDLPWQLQAARFLAPVATGYAVFEAVRSLFADQFVLMRTRRMRGHAVVVGRTPAADLIAEALAARGHRVSLDGFDELIAHLATVHPSKYIKLIQDVEFIALTGVHELSNQNAALRLVAFIDRVYDAEVPIIASGVPLDRVFDDEMMAGGYRKKYLRAMSRMIALTTGELPPHE